MKERKKTTLHLVCIFCRCRVVFLRSFISALFLYFFLHWPPNPRSSSDNDHCAAVSILDRLQVPTQSVLESCVRGSPKLACSPLFRGFNFRGLPIMAKIGHLDSFPPIRVKRAVTSSLPYATLMSLPFASGRKTRGVQFDFFLNRGISSLSPSDSWKNSFNRSLLKTAGYPPAHLMRIGSAMWMGPKSLVPKLYFCLSCFFTLAVCFLIVKFSRNDHYRSDVPKWLPPGPNKQGSVSERNRCGMVIGFY